MYFPHPDPDRRNSSVQWHSIIYSWTSSILTKLGLFSFLYKAPRDKGCGADDAIVACGGIGLKLAYTFYNLPKSSQRRFHLVLATRARGRGVGKPLFPEEGIK